jgi:hypothetical protein
MSLRFCMLVTLAACGTVVDVPALEALPVFPTVRQPWALDARGTVDASYCKSPFGFDWDMGERVAEVVYLSALTQAAARKQVKIGGDGRFEPARFSGRTTEQMRALEQTLWRTVTGARGERHEPFTPLPEGMGPHSVNLGSLCLLPTRMGFGGSYTVGTGADCASLTHATTYHFGENGSRIEQPDRLTSYQTSEAILVLRAPELLLLARTCEGFGCVQIDWVQLQGQPYAEHMIFDERGGSGERHYFVSGTARTQQRTYRRSENGIACELDLLEFDDDAGLTKPWADVDTAMKAPYADQVFDQSYRVGNTLTLEDSDDPALPAPGSKDVYTFTIQDSGDTSLDGLMGMGFTASAGDDRRSIGLAHPKATLDAVYHMGVRTSLRARR